MTLLSMHPSHHHTTIHQPEVFNRPTRATLRQLNDMSTIVQQQSTLSFYPLSPQASFVVDLPSLITHRSGSRTPHCCTSPPAVDNLSTDGLCDLDELDWRSPPPLMSPPSYRHTYPSTSDIDYQHLRNYRSRHQSTDTSYSSYRLSTSQSHSWIPDGRLSKLSERSSLFRSGSRYALSRISSELNANRLDAASKQRVRSSSYRYRSSNYGNVMSSSNYSSTPNLNVPRHRSLTGVRTYYAFGARSEKNPSHDFVFQPHQRMPSYRQPVVNYSSTKTPSYRKDITIAMAGFGTSSLSAADSWEKRLQSRRTTDSYMSNRPYSSSSYQTTSHYHPRDYTVSNVMTTSDYISRPNKLHTSRFARSSGYDSPSQRYRHYNKSAITGRHAEPAYRSPGYTPSSYYPSSIDLLSHSINVPSTSDTTSQSVSEVPSIPSKHHVAMPQIVEHVSVQAGSPKLQRKRTNESLEHFKDKNKSLEDEVDRLSRQLKDRDRKEIELKRRLLESEAEVKVWREKFEQQLASPPTVIHVKDEDEHSEISDELVGQLGLAAQKLTKPVQDMAQLQSEMQRALQQMDDSSNAQSPPL